MKLLDLQIATERSKRTKRAPQRALILISSILMILIGAAGALFVAQRMLADFADRGNQPAESAGMPAR